MTQRPDGAIVLLACGGAFSLYYAAFATDLESRCSAVAISACVVYWGLTGLAWAVGAAALGFAAAMFARPRVHRAAGGIVTLLVVGFLLALALLLRSASGLTGSSALFLLIFLWPFILVAIGGLLALLWKPRERPSLPTAPPASWPPPPTGLPPSG